MKMNYTAWISLWVFSFAFVAPLAAADLPLGDVVQNAYCYSVPSSGANGSAAYRVTVKSVGGQAVLVDAEGKETATQTVSASAEGKVCVAMKGTKLGQVLVEVVAWVDDQPKGEPVLHLMNVIAKPQTLSLSAVVGSRNIVASTEYTDGLVVTVKDGEVAASGKTVTVRVSEGKATLVGDAEKQIDAEGMARFSFKTAATSEDVTFLVGLKDESGVWTTATARTAAYQQDVGSDRVRVDLVLGTAFHNTYELETMADDKEVVRNKGFNSTSKLAILTFDTLWMLDKIPALHSGVDLAFMSYPVTETETSETPSEENEDKFADYSDALLADVYLHYQPKRFWPLPKARETYSKTNRDTNQPYDAIRLGLILRAGFVNREEIEALNSDRLIGCYGLGLTFRHHKTQAAGPQHDNTNETPLRWVELTPTWFESWGDRDNQVRLVINAGIRINALGNEGIPFYAGLHGNVGAGPDDLQVVAGLVFKLDRLAQMFQ